MKWWDKAGNAGCNHVWRTPIASAQIISEMKLMFVYQECKDCKARRQLVEKEYIRND